MNDHLMVIFKNNLLTPGKPQKLLGIYLLFGLSLCLSLLLSSCTPSNTNPTITPSRDTATKEGATMDPTVEYSTQEPAGVTTPLTAVVTPQPTSLPTVTPASVQTGTTIDEPLFSAYDMRFEGWSPAGSYFAIRSFSAEEMRDRGYDPLGDFYFYNVDTSETCQYPIQNELSLNFNDDLVWLPDGSLLLFNDLHELIQLNQPCVDQITNLTGLFPEPILDINASNENNSIILLGGESAFYFYYPTNGVTRPISALAGLPLDSFAFSPGDTYLGVYLQNGTTLIINVENGQLEYTIPWFYNLGGLGDLGGPIWLSETELLIHASDDGPLFVSLGNDPQPVGPTFFDQPASPTQLARGAKVGDDFTILFSDNAFASDSTPVWSIFHSDTGEVEKVEARDTAVFGDGQWLYLLRPVTVSGYERLTVWLRPLANSDQPPYAIVESDQLFVNPPRYSGNWSPDWRYVIVADETRSGQPAIIHVRDLANGSSIYQWESDRYTTYLPYWSPDGRYVAAIAHHEPGNTNLFIHTIPGNITSDTSPLTDLEKAKETLFRFFNALNQGKYDEAETLYGGEYEIITTWNPDIEPADRTGLLEAACTFQLVCRPVLDVVKGEQTDESRFMFELTFSNPDGSLFSLGPCCGEPKTEQPPQTEFPCSVLKLDDGSFKVECLPVYVP